MKIEKIFYKYTGNEIIKKGDDEWMDMTYVNEIKYLFYGFCVWTRKVEVTTIIKTKTKF